MSRIFLSHSNKDNDGAVALRDWLAAQGWDDVFLDLDPQRGIAAGDRWERSLNQAAQRCEAVLFLVSRAWLSSDWCLKEFNLAHRLNKRLFGLLIEDISIADLPATLTGTWQLVPLASGRDHVILRALLPGSHDEVHVTFSQEGLTRLRIGLERAGLDARFFAWPPENDPKRPPYRGLLPLEAVDAGIFFGREAPTIEALGRIRGMRDGAAPRLLVLLGASGAGKSSFLRAGLLPRLARDDRNYIVLPVVRPERAAITGETGLLRSLQAVLNAQGVTMPRADIRTAIEGGAVALRPLLRNLVARVQTTLVADYADARPPVLVLAIDQGEELFLTGGASEGTALLNLLQELLADDGPALLVVVTIRSDAYEQLQTAKPVEGITQQTLSLTPMPRGAYQAVIEGPTIRLKDSDRPLVIEPALTQALLADIEDGGGRDALPLLAFTLERLYFEYGDRGRLTLTDYNALGRIKGSIEAAIERAFAAADADARIPRDHDARLSLLRRGLIPWLAGIDPDSGSPRRQKARISEIPEETKPLIGLLVEQRLLSTDITEDTGERTIEPAHESMLRQWGSLQGWLQEDFAALTNLETIKRAARDWNANAKGDDWLAHRAGRLDDAERLLQRVDLAEKLDTTDRAYLTACREREEAERKEKTAALERKLALQRRFSVAAMFAAVFMAGAGLYAYAQKTKADSAMASAESNLKTSEAYLKQARINQGHFLSRESTLALANNDPVTAIGLALEALPGRNRDDALYVADAELALFAGILDLREHSILGGHRDGVNSAAFSPDGARIVTASDDRTALVWDAVTGAQLALLNGHKSGLLCAAFSPDGARIVTASEDRTARIWDAATGVQIAVLKGHEGILWSAAFSPDGNRIVTASQDKTVRIWDAVTGAQIELLGEYGGPVRTAAFSPDGKSIVTTSWSDTVGVWDAITGVQIRQLKGHRSQVQSAAFSADGAHIVTASLDKTARIWDAATGTEMVVLKGHEAAVRSAAFSADGTRIVTASDDKTVRIWDAVTGAQIAVPKQDEKEVYSATFSPDGAHILTASGGNTARIWDTVTGVQISVLKGHGDYMRGAAFSPDGARIITTSKYTKIWNAFNGALIAQKKQYDYEVFATAFTPNGVHILAWTAHAAGIVEDAITGAQIAVLQGEHPPSSGAFSLDGARIVTTSMGSNTARVWDAITGVQIRELKGHESIVKSAAFSADGTRIVTASLDKTARIWDALTGAQIRLLKGHQYNVSSAAFNADGARIVTASEDKTARVWDAVTGAQIRLLRGHQANVNSAAFSPDGKRIVTASDDKTVRVWDAVTGAQLAVLRGHHDSVLTAAFSPDGARIVTASVSDDAAIVWDVPRTLDELIEIARKRVPRCLTTAQRKSYFLPPEIPSWCYEMSKWPLKPRS